MKKLGWIMLFACGLAACSQRNKDSLEKADSSNMTRDSGQKIHPVSAEQEISGADAKFADKAAAGGMAEVELGKLAQQRGSSKAIRDFGSMMVKDHSAANAELTDVAKSKHIELPKQLNEESIQLEKQLRAKRGRDFDKAYAEAMVKDHEQYTTDFGHALNILKYPEMVAFAKKTLPVLRMHLAAAKKITSTY